MDLCVLDPSSDSQNCFGDTFMGSNTCFVITPGGQFLINTNETGLYKLGTCGLEFMSKFIIRNFIRNSNRKYRFFIKMSIWEQPVRNTFVAHIQRALFFVMVESAKSIMKLVVK